MKALIFSEGNGFGHVARDKILSEHFEFPIMTFGKGAQYCKSSSMDFIEIPTPYVIQSGNGKVQFKSEISDLIGFLRPDAMSTIKDHFSKVDFIIVDGSSPALAVAMLTGKKSIFITNDTSSLIGIYGSIQKKITASLSNTVLKSADSIIVPDFPPPLTISMLNLDNMFAMDFAGPIIEKTQQKKHTKKYLVVGALEEKLRPMLGDEAIYGGTEKGIKSFYQDAEVVICHGGHTTIMEALSHGKPVICITDKNYSERYNNASMLEQKGTGILLEEKLLNKQSILLSIEYTKTLNQKRLELYKNLAQKLDPLKVVERAISKIEE